MTFRNAPPVAEAMIESLRGLGYSTATALADIIDNSISAGASEIDIRFDWAEAHSRVSIRDNGAGMTDAELETAMRLGARDPRHARSSTDLGRFGMGLKTASFSQARRLTVASRRAGETIVCLRWDLDRLGEAAGGGWPLFEGAHPGSEHHLSALDIQPHGTIVLWECLDRIVSEGFKAQDMIDLVDQVERHLAMTFHRLIDDPARPLKLTLNGRPVAAWDPFMTGHPGKALESSEFRLIHTTGVMVQEHVLPHRDMLKPAEADAAAGPAGWTSQQGFYIYRNRRLLVAGGWLGLGERGRAWTRDEAHRLARIRLDIPNSADAEWKINILKSTASPPVILRPQLQRIAAETRERARLVFAHRGHLLPSAGRAQGVRDVWDAVKTRNGTAYRISREHDLVASLLDRAGPLKTDILALLRLVEETVPVQRIWLDTAEDKDTPATGFTAASEEDVRTPLAALFRALVLHSGLTEPQARDRLQRTPPFERYTALIDALKIEDDETQ
ncbi:histidine kinase/DNA gyrase B/HSP90-like ATPase [Rhodobacter viridis]|uniref:Histidine kinase/DNA gyrase B/HSP90-like ATPase n=2 Tax=Rhodobacter viridis TaxID=1054202 RepID=A0A318TZ02_9RHOB|nr:histidine kinase/DNA gyrase B/HSP90-like ATPase [Rhodobacter viridis]